MIPFADCAERTLLKEMAVEGSLNLAQRMRVAIAYADLLGQTIGLALDVANRADDSPAFPPPASDEWAVRALTHALALATETDLGEYLPIDGEDLRAALERAQSRLA